MNREFSIAVGADIVLVTDEHPAASILLIERRNDPYAGCWALPGGFVEIDEDLATGAARELEEETGISGVELTQIGAFGRPDRDPRGRVISVAFSARLPASRKGEAKAADDAKEARWFPINSLPSLAFDHDEIIAKALKSHCSVE